jgi:hypothetical protein
MRAQVLDVVTTLNVLQRAGMTGITSHFSFYLFLSFEIMDSDRVFKKKKKKKKIFLKFEVEFL